MKWNSRMGEGMIEIHNIFIYPFFLEEEKEGSETDEGKGQEGAQVPLRRNPGCRQVHIGKNRDEDPTFVSKYPDPAQLKKIPDPT